MESWRKIHDYGSATIRTAYTNVKRQAAMSVEDKLKPAVKLENAKVDMDMGSAQSSKKDSYVIQLYQLRFRKFSHRTNFLKSMELSVTELKHIKNWARILH